MSIASSTTATIAVRKVKEPVVAPYLYTTKFNKTQDLLFAGGAGKNEMRVYDWNTGSIVANISNLPQPIICSAQANNSSMFCFGAVDSRVRVFNIVNSSSQFSVSDSQSISGASLSQATKKK